VSKRALLAEIYAAATRSIGVPVPLDSAVVAMFRLVLGEYLDLHRLREHIAEQAAIVLGDNPDSRRLMTVPGIGLANALTILAEAGDLRRFRHHRQFLNFCGLNLSTLQSGKSRGPEPHLQVWQCQAAHRFVDGGADCDPNAREQFPWQVRQLCSRQSARH
jgi:transposase